MRTAAPREMTERPISAARFRNGFIATVFALAQIVPNLLHLRRNPRSWLVFRVALGFAGAALVVLPLSVWNSWIAAIIGLAMFTAAILLPSANADTSADRKARELGALLVVNGGKYQPGNAPAMAVRIFVGAEHIWALDSRFQPLLVVPTAEIASVRAEESGGRWNLQIRWTGHTAEFSYRGFFAEHLARAAESTLRSVMRTSLPALPKRRAASA
ncbi:MAG TPA: hypothetical protein VHF01_06415 [Candidatus Acidoferrum sp.]|nr:hypothetical protein [Candidatus Acidoferrum sp.]